MVMSQTGVSVVSTWHVRDTPRPAEISEIGEWTGSLVQRLVFLEVMAATDEVLPKDPMLASRLGAGVVGRVYRSWDQLVYPEVRLGSVIDEWTIDTLCERCAKNHNSVAAVLDLRSTLVRTEPCRV